MTKLLSVVGARPNFMKLAPVDRLLRARGTRHVIVHTGQHYDANMSDRFFTDLAIPAPHYNLEVGSGSHAQQTGQIMQRFEPILLDEAPDIVLVYGDVNSTVAAALVAAKLGVAVGHVEAGLRSRDWSMPEEINRVLTDRLASLLFTPSRDADENLAAEGIVADRIHFVGNVMIDALVAALPAARAACAAAVLGLERGQYTVVTLHRPSNVDHREPLAELLSALDRLGERAPVIFPIHPRTRQRLREFDLRVDNGRVRLVDPIPYLEMLSLVADAGLVLTDSGGLQEETSYLGVPCLTARPNTERPVTVTHGTNRLVASRAEDIVAAAGDVWGKRSGGGGIELWDGRAAERIADVLLA